MSHVSKGFPAFCFPKSSTKAKGHAVVDYGISDVIDIDVRNQRVETTARKSSTASECQPYNPGPFCLPLASPNKAQNLPCFDEIQDVWINPHARNPYHIGKILKTTKKQHFNRFFMDYPDLLIGNILNEMTNSQIDLLFRHFHPLKYAFDIPYKYSFWVTPPDNYWQFFKDSQKQKNTAMGRFDPQNHKTKIESSSFLQKMDEILDIVSEIPRDILLDYLDESLSEKYEILTDNYHLGNCLSSCNDILMYPQGSMDTLDVAAIVFNEQNEDDDISEVHLEHCQSLKLPGEIKENTLVSYESKVSMLGIRTDYSCAFFSKQLKGNENEQTRDGMFKTVDVVKTESRVLSMAVNPYMNNDAIICLENGNFQHWTDGAVLNLDHEVINSGCNCNELFWINCIFGSTPKSFLVTHAEDVRLYDMRCPLKPSCLMLQLPSPFLNRMDKLARPAALHPNNPHQILFTSEQSLIVLDERFVNSPVIAVNHQMRSSPKFLQIFTEHIENSLHTTAFLGGYKYRDTRCLELEEVFSRGIMPKVFGYDSMNDYSTRPISCVRKPWKLSAYDSWLRACPNDSRIFSPSIETRLKQPLIGLDVLPLTNSQSKDLIAVQLSRTGDLFYQMLEKEPLSGCRTNRPMKVRERSFEDGIASEKQKRRCRKWVDQAFEYYNTNPELNEHANINLQRLMLTEGNIADASKIQMEHSEVFKQHFMGSAGNCKILEKTTEDCQHGEEYLEPSDGDNLVTVRTNHFDDDLNIGTGNQETSCWKTDNVRKDFRNSSLRRCRVCCFPLNNNEDPCSCCEIGTTIADNLILARKGNSFYTNSSLGIAEDITLFNFVKHPEKSRDPLSVVLLKNWNSDEVYTPIDLSNKKSTDTAETLRPGRKRKIVFTREGDMGSDDIDHDYASRSREEDWYLSESGTLNYGKKPSLSPKMLTTDDTTISKAGSGTKGTSRIQKRKDNANCKNLLLDTTSDCRKLRSNSRSRTRKSVLPQSYRENCPSKEDSLVSETVKLGITRTDVTSTGSDNLESSSYENTLANKATDRQDLLDPVTMSKREKTQENESSCISNASAVLTDNESRLSTAKQRVSNTDIIKKIDEFSKSPLEHHQCDDITERSDMQSEETFVSQKQSEVFSLEANYASKSADEDDLHRSLQDRNSAPSQDRSHLANALNVPESGPKQLLVSGPHLLGRQQTVASMPEAFFKPSNNSSLTGSTAMKNENNMMSDNSMLRMTRSPRKKKTSRVMGF